MKTYIAQTNVVEATPDQTKVNGLANPNYTTVSLTLA